MNITLQQKEKVLQKLFEAGITDEKAIRNYSLEDLAKMQDIKAVEVVIINDMRKAVTKGCLFSYLAEEYRNGDETNE